MSKEKMKAAPEYNEKLGKWIINVMVDGEKLPVGKHTDDKTQIFFKYKTFETREDAVKWIKEKDGLEYNDVKIYAFNDYDYFALIAVDGGEKYPMAVAIAAYNEEIAEYEDEKDNTPDEITLDDAIEIYKKAWIEGCSTEASKIIDFYERIDLDTEHEQDYEIMLIDGSLC